MYDCLEVNPSRPFNSLRTGLPKDSLNRRFNGRNWVRIRNRDFRGFHDLAKAQEIARHLDAELHQVDDGSIAIVGLSLNEMLALNERFGQTLAIEAVIAI